MSGRKKLPKPVISTTNNKTIRKKKTHQFSQALISKFHVLNKEKDRLKQQPPSTEVLERLNQIDKEMEHMGGLDAYQKASLLGQDKRRGGDSSKWFIKQLLSMKKPEHFKSDKNYIAGKPSPPETYSLLDVGAVSGSNYIKEGKWIKTKAIDLNPQDSLVEKADFFEFPIPQEKYQILCLSLVINFVGDPKRRGIMIARANKFLVTNGLLFVVLPNPCVNNSRYCTNEHFKKILEYLGFKLETSHISRKLVYYLFRKIKEINNLSKIQNSKPKFPKVLLNDGVSTNNFCVVI
jgi:25S rRNA (adenine2142-N1)-methyltransferase